jgi:monofunctional biosynthetic peptidoglycan transglycosylase
MGSWISRVAVMASLALGAGLAHAQDKPGEALPWAPDGKAMKRAWDGRRKSTAAPESKAPRGAARYRPASCQEFKEETADIEMNGSEISETVKVRVTAYVCGKRKGTLFWRSLDQIAPVLAETVVFLEDAKFWSHEGVDADGMLDALQEDIKTGSFKRGGSTITQQLAKNLFLSKEKTLVRKVKELQHTVALERELTKREILELYLNVIEWGPGLFGAEAAARTYFDKTALELTREEAWLMALMIPNPKELCLWFRPRAKKSLEKRAESLTARLWQEKHMSRAGAAAALDEFVAFMNTWSVRVPTPGAAANRRFPAVWDEGAYGGRRRETHQTQPVRR